MDIDFVVTWVDSADPVWRKEFNLYINSTEQSLALIDASEERYRDWGLLKYWFRGIERYAPWVRYIHFVTYGHIPSWLDTTNPKIKIVRHEDYIPKQYLPLFNSRPIELMMHQIPDLAEHFVYFNDDFYLTKPILPEYFFKNGKPVDMAVAKNHHSQTDVMLGAIRNEMNIIHQEFNLWKSIFMHSDLWFRCEYRGFLKLTLRAVLSGRIVSLLDTHAPTPYLKNTFITIWSKYREPLENAMGYRFRSSDGLSHWLFRYWQIAAGDIHPGNIFLSNKVFYKVGTNIKEVETAISESRYSVLVLNDSSDMEDLESVILRVNAAFNTILPEKSSFEK